MAEKRTIRILIVEDHPLFGQGLRRVLELEPDFTVVGEIADGQVAVDKAPQLKPDVILMDINLPSLNGLQATRLIKTNNETIAVIVLTAYHDDEQLFHALRAGAAAYFPKDVMPSEIRKHFEELAVFGESADEMFVPLSPREMEILQYITRGASNKEIARELGISRQTVKNHMSSILRKLAVNDRTQAAVLALRRGWVRLQDTTADA